MRGKTRTQDQKYELFSIIEPHLKDGYSLRRSCHITNVPYTSMRDAIRDDEVLRTKMTVAQNDLVNLAWKNVRNSLTEGDLKTSKWFLEKKTTFEDMRDPYEGGSSEPRYYNLQSIMETLGLDSFEGLTGI